VKNPNEIEVVDPIIVTPENNAEKFDNWMRKLGNIFVGNNERMERAYNLILE